MNITTHFCSTSKSRHKNAADYWHRTTVYKRLDKLQATSKSGIEIGSLSQWGGEFGSYMVKYGLNGLQCWIYSSVDLIINIMYTVDSLINVKSFFLLNFTIKHWNGP